MLRTALQILGVAIVLTYAFGAGLWAVSINRWVGDREWVRFGMGMLIAHFVLASLTWYVTVDPVVVP